MFSSYSPSSSCSHNPEALKYESVYRECVTRISLVFADCLTNNIHTSSSLCVVFLAAAPQGLQPRDAEPLKFMVSSCRFRRCRERLVIFIEAGREVIFVLLLVFFILVVLFLAICLVFQCLQKLRIRFARRKG